MLTTTPIMKNETLKKNLVLALMTCAMVLPAAAQSNAGGNGNSQGNGSSEADKPKVIHLEMKNHNAELTCSGSSKESYCVEATTSLTQPVVWTTVCTNVADAKGKFSAVDTCASNYPVRFYRVVWQSKTHPGVDNGATKGNK